MRTLCTASLVRRRTPTPHHHHGSPTADMQAALADCLVATTCSASHSKVVCIVVVATPLHTS